MYVEGAKSFFKISINIKTFGFLNILMNKREQSSLTSSVGDATSLTMKIVRISIISFSLIKILSLSFAQRQYL